ncbi:MAG: MHS family MFS transporter [Saprospiraceae bacterium]|nr:MHS family MFS transporter [Saprospiraceae bacterium]
MTNPSFSDANAGAPFPDEKKWGIGKVIAASSVGTLIEWYDFYIFGSLAVIISSQFFPSDNPTAAILSTLATFAAGFIVRPFGALVFGRLGDLIGRKYTFLLTLLIMGLSTFGIGLVPNYASIGAAAPIIILILRLLQGLALGGEYGGAATYVAEHSPIGKRGFYTSFIQTTATLGLFLSLIVIVATRQSVGVDAFNEWGWRLPFLGSVVLIGISVYIRMKMSESPMFAKIKEEGTVSKNPLKESFAHRGNLKMVLLALFGATAGQGVVWYTGQFYALSFIQRTCNVEFVQSNWIIAVAVLLATPFFIVFAAWSDRVGRKWIMLAGMALAVLCYRPIYKGMYGIADLETKTEISAEKKEDRSVVFDATNGDSILVAVKTSKFTDGAVFVETTKASFSFLSQQQLGNSKAQKPEVKKSLTLPPGGFWKMVLLVFLQVIFVTMVYGPIAAFLVELFPTRIRYTSMSLPYHIGNGVFGGLTPFIATRLYEASKTEVNPIGDPYAGLMYPTVIAAVCFVIGALYMSNKRDENVMD